MSLQLSWRRYRLPFRQPVRTAHGWWTEREGLLVRLEDATGRTGWGDVTPIPVFGTVTVDEAEAELGRLGSRWERPGASRARADLELSGVVRFALASAEADVAAAGGGTGEATAEPAAAARAYWPVAAWLPAGRAALAAVEPQLEAGFRTFKWKVGVGDPADELALLDDLLAKLGGGVRLRLDANGAWNRRQAERWLACCAERPVEFVEQPVAANAAGATDLLLGLAADYPTPLALDESLVGPGDLRQWRDLGWRGVWVVKLALAGDPRETLAELAAAQADVVFSSALETQIGAVAGLRAAFDWPGAARALGYGVWPLFDDRRFDGPWRAPFVRREDLRSEGSMLWNALN